MFNCTNFPPLIFHERSLIYEQTLQRPVCTFIDLYCPPGGSLSKSEERGEKSSCYCKCYRSKELASSSKPSAAEETLSRVDELLQLATEQHTARQYVLFLKL